MSNVRGSEVGFAVGLLGLGGSQALGILGGIYKRLGIATPSAEFELIDKIILSDYSGSSIVMS